jgi:hypothetical protein
MRRIHVLTAIVVALMGTRNAAAAAPDRPATTVQVNITDVAGVPSDGTVPVSGIVAVTPLNGALPVAGSISVPPVRSIAISLRISIPEGQSSARTSYFYIPSDSHRVAFEQISALCQVATGTPLGAGAPFLASLSTDDADMKHSSVTGIGIGLQPLSGAQLPSHFLIPSIPGTTLAALSATPVKQYASPNSNLGGSIRFGLELSTFTADGVTCDFVLRGRKEPLPN